MTAFLAMVILMAAVILIAGALFVAPEVGVRVYQWHEDKERRRRVVSYQRRGSRQ